LYPIARLRRRRLPEPAEPTATSFFLDASAPTATQPKCRDWATVNFSKGNPWQVIGTWSLPAP